MQFFFIIFKINNFWYVWGIWFIVYTFRLLHAFIFIWYVQFCIYFSIHFFGKQKHKDKIKLLFTSLSHSRFWRLFLSWFEVCYWCSIYHYEHIYFHWIVLQCIALLWTSFEDNEMTFCMQHHQIIALYHHHQNTLNTIKSLYNFLIYNLNSSGFEMLFCFLIKKA